MPIKLVGMSTLKIGYFSVDCVETTLKNMGCSFSEKRKPSLGYESHGSTVSITLGKKMASTTIYNHEGMEILCLSCLKSIAVRLELPAAVLKEIKENCLVA